MPLGDRVRTSKSPLSSRRETESSRIGRVLEDEDQTRPGTCLDREAMRNQFAADATSLPCWGYREGGEERGSVGYVWSETSDGKQDVFHKLAIGDRHQGGRRSRARVRHERGREVDYGRVRKGRALDR